MKNRNTIVFLVALIPFLSLHSSSLRANGSSKTPHFTENKGQIADQLFRPRPDILFAASVGDLVCHFKKNGVSYQLNKKVSGRLSDKSALLRGDFSGLKALELDIYRIDVEWLGCSPLVKPSASGAIPGYENFYSEAAPAGVLGVNSYESIVYTSLYEGIDVKWYSFNGQLKYDYLVAPHADYRKIVWEIKGAQSITLNKSGDLMIKTPLGDLVEQAPLVYQQGKQLKARWHIEGRRISFEINGINSDYPIVIDPLLRLWGTYYGSAGVEDWGFACTDLNNNSFFTGSTTSQTSINIATTGAHQTTYGGIGTGTFPGDVFLVKFNAAGVRQWATYYGGSGADFNNGCASDQNGNVYMVGGTNSSASGVIASAGAYQPALSPSPTGATVVPADAFIAKFSPAGVRIWATYYGDTLEDWAIGVCVDGSGDVLMCGGSYQNGGTVLATPGSHQVTHSAGGFNTDCYLVKFSSAGSRLWSTYYGGAGFDAGYSCAADQAGNIYLGGATTTSISTDISTPGSHQQNFGGGISDDGFLVKFNGAGTRQWATYYGGTGNEWIFNLGLDNTANIFVSGRTNSNPGTSIGTPGTHQPAFGGSDDVYVSKFNSSGVRKWGTYYGGSGFEDGGLGCVSPAGNYYLCGFTGSSSGTVIATCGGYQQTHGGGGYDAFIVAIDSLGGRMWGTYFGGTGMEGMCALTCDQLGNIFLYGTTGSITAASVISSTGAHQTTYGGGAKDVFIQKFNGCSLTVPQLSYHDVACIGQAAVFTATQTCGLKYYSDASLTNLIYSGGSFTTNVLFNDTTIYVIDQSCGTNSPPAVLSLTAGPSPTVNILSSTLPVCIGAEVHLFANGANSYSWTGLTSGYSLAATPSINTTYTVVGIYPNGCKATATLLVPVEECTGLRMDDHSAMNHLFPNPVGTSARLKLSDSGMFRLWGISGNLVWKPTEVDNGTALDFSGLPEGVYFGELQIAENTERFKIVVSR